MVNSIALIAQGKAEDQMIRLVQDYHKVLYRYTLIAPEEMAQQLERALILVKLSVQEQSSVVKGGIVQIAAQVAEGKISAVFCFVDPHSPLGNLPDYQVLQRLCILQDIPFALNRSTAVMILEKLRRLRVAHLIFNPVSGQNDPDDDLDLIQSLLGSAMTLRVHRTEADVHPGEIVREAIANQADLIVASGGDGTISAVAGALSGTDIPLGIIPRGTANAFAAALGIARGFAQIRNACRIIIQGKTAVIDLAKCNDQPMILLAGIGLEAEVVERANREAKDRWGVLAYIMEGVKQFNSQELFETEIEIEGVVKRFQAGAVTIANAAPPTSVMAQGGGQVNVRDGLLDLTIAAPQSDLKAISAMVNLVGAALLRSETNREDIIHLQTKQVRVTTSPPQKVVVDGEMIGTTPVEATSIPKGLTVFVPEKEIKERS